MAKDKRDKIQLPVDLGDIALSIFIAIVGVLLNRFGAWLLDIPVTYSGLVNITTGTRQLTLGSQLVEWGGILLWLIGILAVVLGLWMTFNNITDYAAQPSNDTPQKEIPTKPCPNCQRAVPLDTSYCPSCAARIK